MRDYIELCEAYIAELTGYKGADEFEAFKGLRNKLTKSGDSLQDGLKRYELMKQFMDHLRKLGYEPLGAGGYGCVFTHPDVDYAIKVFEADKAYLTFVKYVLASPENPHFPKFRGRFVKIVDDFFAVRVEKLTPLDPSLREEIAACLMAYGDRSMYPEDMDEFEQLLADYPHLEAAMRGIITVCRAASARPDVNGSSNILSREGFPVFSDPVRPRN